jgi:hypothetical protein
MPVSKLSRLVTETADQKMVAGTQQFLMKLPTILVGSQSLTPADVVKIFQDRVASSQTVQTATATRTAAIKADRDKRTQTAPLVKAFRRVVQGMFSESPDTLAAFGLQPIKVGTRTVATKATAVDKTLATREARHTMGTKQKKNIHGTPPSATTAPAAPEPVASPGPVAGPAPVATPAPVTTGPVATPAPVASPAPVATPAPVAPPGR